MSSRSIAILAVVIIGVAPVLLAFHSLSAYDNQHLTILKGTVAEFKWGNPHVRVALDVKDDQGKTEQWRLLLERPGLLKRNGWNPNTLQAGEEVTAQVHIRKDGLKIARVQRFILANGKMLGTRAAE